MFGELLVAQNPHWEGKALECCVKRACFERLLDYFETGQIVALTGVRRAGKSTLLKQLIEHLTQNKGVSAKNVLFFNLEHPSLSLYREDVGVLQRIYEDYLKLMRPEGEVFVFLDEVQFFREWPLFVKAHHEMKKVRFVVTGSNAAMVSSDMITMLSGRSLAIEVFPFSLRELVSSRSINISNSHEITLKHLEIKRALDDIIEYGGFPTVALRSLNQTAFDILGNHAKTVLLQDVAPRIGVRKPADLEKLYVYLVSNISKLFSYSSLSKLFGLSDKSIKEYLEAFVQAYLIFEVDLFSYSLKTQVRSLKKVYSIDTGQANAMGFRFTVNQGRLLENLILIDLKRLKLDVYYYKTKNNFEIDFVVKDAGAIALIQVAWEINSPETFNREIRALEHAMMELNCEFSTIIVYEMPLSIANLPKNIQIIPACQYLMMNFAEQKLKIFKVLQ